MGEYISTALRQSKKKKENKSSELRTPSASFHHQTDPPTGSCPHILCLPSCFPGWIVPSPLRVQPLCVVQNPISSCLFRPSSHSDPSFSALPVFALLLDHCYSAFKHVLAPPIMKNVLYPKFHSIAKYIRRIFYVQCHQFFHYICFQPIPIRFNIPWELLLARLPVTTVL